MDCPDCAQAAREQWDCYSSGCAGCEKRMVDAIAAVRADEGPAEECPS